MRERPVSRVCPMLRVAAAIFVLLLCVISGLSRAAIYVVSNTLDGGGGSLRDQINAANANPGLDEIIFAIPSPGPHTIQPLSPLPILSDSLVIDGYTQTGASPATAAAPATLKIELDGQFGGGNCDGIAVAANGCVVRGLAINRFSRWGAILSAWTEGAVIEGNYLGTDISGTIALGNGIDGIHICDGTNNTIGGPSSASRNVISGNQHWGVSVCVGPYENHIVGNYIGTDATGSVPLGNEDGGVVITYSGNAVGGIGPGEGNVIAFNGGPGVAIYSGIVCNPILSNWIFSNAALGIDLGQDGVTLNDSCDVDGGANNLQNHPILSVADLGPPFTLIDVFLNSTPNTTFRFEFFENNLQDPSACGEGELYAAWAEWPTDGAGNAFFTVFFDPPVAPGHCVTATATDPIGNTSEFSPVVYVGGGIMLSGWPAGGALQLEWTPIPGSVAYRLFGAGNDAYFEVEPPHFLMEFPPTVTTWSGLPAVGDPALNCTYVVVAVGGYDQEIARSNRFGEWDFGTGSP